ncbi:hypothetical protein C8Q80DRAFT_1157006 [Daedaleopsis nitida]|nr:hypothetical protein C8Q80DRAFT_1157006 [Daedaleopsis nitida]
MRPVCYSYADRGTCRYGDRCKFRHIDGASFKKMREEAAQIATLPTPRPESTPPKLADSLHIADFFALYPTYRYDPSASFMDEFYNLCDHMEWDGDHAERKVARTLLEEAAARQFNEIYGTSVNDADAWVLLFRTLGMDKIPDNWKACRSIVMGCHFNLCDLISAPALGRPRRFSTQTALIQYSERTGRVISRNNPYAGPLLRMLLRNRLSKAHASVADQH